MVLLIRVAIYHNLPTSQSDIHTLPAAEDISVYEYQKRTFSRLTQSHLCLKSIRQFFTSRHSV